MKFNPQVSSSRRKSRKAHFAADSTSRLRLMSAPLAKELREKHGVRSLPIRKDDRVIIVRGSKRKHEGKVIRVHRKDFKIEVEGYSRENGRGTSVAIPVHPSKVAITAIKMDTDRKAKLEARKLGRVGKAKTTATGGATDEMD